MIKKVKYNDNEAKILSAELQKEIDKLKTLLNKLESNIQLLENGDNWNGSNAYEIHKSLTGHFDHDKTLLTKLEKCSASLESVIK